jgi:2-polyprenyl-6-methoxyphenol hydroxylase-like FAD-dependent oxidoreductase
MRPIGEHAVVLGAGMAGLIAARVLSDAYGRVTVIERDPLPPGAEHRRGVPQGRHAHLLIPSGTQILDGLFAGLLEDLATAGVPVIRDFAEFRLAPGGGEPLRLRGRPAEPFVCQAGRPRLEGHVRTRVNALPNVEFVDHCEATGLTSNAAKDRVTGVRVRRHAPRGAHVIDADLVLDATGRNSPAPAWLAALGYDRPRQEQLAINLMYVTRHLRLRPGALPEKVIGIGAAPDRPSGLVLFAQEGGDWILTVFGYEGHHPPRDHDGVLDVVAAIAPPDIFAAIRDAEPVDDILAFRFPANVRRRYEQMRRFPAGYLVFGDALCSTNPAYALGMSVSLLQAAVLRDALAGGDRDLARRFFRSAAVPVNMAWQLTMGGDLALPPVKGPRPLPVRVIGRYARRVQRAATRDSVVAGQVLRVASLQDRSTRLLRPAVAVRALRYGAHRPAEPAIDRFQPSARASS